jgi:predicted nucleic acid-binding protein
MSGTEKPSRRRGQAAPKAKSKAKVALTTWAGLPLGAQVLVDTAPLIYLLGGHARFLPLFLGLFEADAAGELHIAISTITLAEVLTGPLRGGHDALALRYEKALANYTVVPVSSTIAALAARMRARYGLKLPDAIQLATALELEAAALVTHDRDFAKVEGLSIIRGIATRVPEGSATMEAGAPPGSRIRVYSDENAAEKSGEIG